MRHRPADTVLMIAPVRFSFNAESAVTNSFQKPGTDIGEKEINQRARAEFDQLAEKLHASGVKVIRFEDTTEPVTPDSIFPNNWFSTHRKGHLYVYPMTAVSRRAERRYDVISHFRKEYAFEVIDHSAFETSSPPLFLEGTGSLVFDHGNGVVYAARSPRTNEELVRMIARELEMEAVIFDAFGKDGEAIYHTNVMLSIGDGFAVVGSGAIAEYDRERVLSHLDTKGQEVIEMSNNQIYEHFAGNVLQLMNSKGERVLVMSEAAEKSFSETQLSRLGYYNDILLSSPIPTIESVGGGSVRCMLAEIFY